MEKCSNTAKKSLNSIKAVILAAGKGTRMKSETPKVLHEIFNKPLLARVLDAANGAGVGENIVVTGHKSELVEKYLKENYSNALTVLQKEQLGTGHALKIASEKLKGYFGCVLVLCGDTPLITSDTLIKFIQFHNENNADITVMSAFFDNPTGYGRIVKDENKCVEKIVEEKDACPEIKAIKEVNAGVYCFKWEKIEQGVNEIKNDNAQKEFYLTDLIKWANSRSKKVCSYVLPSSEEIFGINSKENLATATDIMRKRKLQELMKQGVTIQDVNTTSVSPETEIAPDTVILPSVVIEGKNKIGKNCKIGPFSHLRGDCIIHDNVKIGNFVELKKAEVQSDTNICHLSYVGDSAVGMGVNIGAGTITANYDSRTKKKSKTIIKNGVSIGSNTVLVAPVEIGEKAMVGAGSIITKNVEKASLALTRSPQKEIKNYIK